MARFGGFDVDLAFTGGWRNLRKREEKVPKVLSNVRTSESALSEVVPFVPVNAG